ncbi:murein DD-endopeptidase MepM/ murein hydrolase activator NlpD [Sphingomonas insulae]|uniref:M23ase beta-sheet core domain-containing protein n=1 Tax=Sphingomonas insulae TaxID=424800 RepID=A0ABP3T1M5_9SPHN|nr:M23 family metallopeptidase [Sphingomonas insulae]NIJ28894.1 murein DD-endopeptidase MepM/ murein hydrolase activator NlpD [Sphingomonas insulae]
MSRLGWIILAVVVVVAGAFLSMTSFGSTERRTSRVAVAASAPDAEPAPERPGQLVVPVAGVRPSAIADSWNDPRGGGSRGHHGTDIPAPGGTAVVAAAAGRVEKLFRSGLGGITVYIRSPDRRWIYYYAHLAGYTPGLAEGQAVRAGQSIAYVGDTGDAGEGNYHLHFGMQRMQPDQRWYQGEDVNPYPMLAAAAPTR